MRKNIWAVAALLTGGISMGLFSCAKDSVKPNLAIGTPNDNSQYILPDTFNVEGSLQDGNMDQYKVHIVLQDPCEDIDTTSDGINFGLSSYLFVSSPNFNQNTFTHTVFLPADFTPGTYSCIVSAIVGQFNEGKDTVDLYIRNIVDTVRPVVTLSEPAMPSVNINKEDTLRIFGLIDEKRTGLIQGEMHRVKIMLEPTFTGQSSLTVSNETTFSSDSIRVKYRIPASIVSGGYILKITLLDEFNNYTIYTYNVQVN